MNDDQNSSKEEFIRILRGGLESASADETSAREYLEAEGIDVDALVEDQMKRIKLIRFKMDAAKTRAQMTLLERFREKAEDFLDDLIQNKHLTLTQILTTEHLAVQNRNLKNQTDADLRNTLINHFALKFSNSESDKA
jgi:hypothetical protein